MRVYIVSDLHMGDGTRKEDFHADAEFCELLNKIASEDAILVINGDFLELWQCKLRDVLAAHGEVIHNLQRLWKKAIIVAGNHDKELLEGKRFFGIPVHGRVLLGKTLIMHGHQFDPFNSRFAWIGRFIAKIGGFLERILHRDVDKWFEKAKDRLCHLGRYAPAEKYREAALAYIERWSGVDTIVLGHTHKKDHFSRNGKTYINSGSWLNGQRDIVVLEEQWERKLRRLSPL